MHNIRVVAGYIALILLALTASYDSHAAESGADGSTVEFGDKGIVFRDADTSSEVRMRFRMQAWSNYTSQSINDLSFASLDGLIRRARLQFSGHLFDPSIQYKIELGFSRSDIAFGAPDHPNVILDAIGYWQPVKSLKVGFGQTKLPGNRQRVVSSSEMEFPDRSIVNGVFNIDRDGGFFAAYTPVSGDVVLNLAGALTTGEGRNQPAYEGSGLAYTGRVEVLPLGSFSDKGDYVEGDLFHEPTPKVSLGLSAHYNDLMGRTRGQLGATLYDLRSSTVMYADGLVKWQGWALYGEWAQRSSDNPITYNADSTATSNVYVGTGAMGQLSYTFPFMLSIAGRYGITNGGSQLVGQKEYVRNTQIAGCISYYIKGHRIKTQLEVGADRTVDLQTNVEKQNNMHARFNVEIGI